MKRQNQLGAEKYCLITKILNHCFPLTVAFPMGGGGGRWRLHIQQMLGFSGANHSASLLQLLIQLRNSNQNQGGIKMSALWLVQMDWRMWLRPKAQKASFCFSLGVTPLHPSHPRPLTVEQLDD